MVWLEILNPINNLASESMLALVLQLINDVCCVQHGVSTFEIIIDFSYVSDFVFFLNIWLLLPIQELLP